MKSYTIHLIRHGLCQGNIEGRYIGRTESPLSMEGLKALVANKTEFDYPKALSFYASPNTRSVDSLKVLYPEADPSVILEMAECDFGKWENKTAKELENDPNFTKWMAGEAGVNPPEGESMAVFMQRVCSGFEVLVKNMMFTGTTSAVLVTHSGVIMTILAAYGMPRAKMSEWICESGKGYSIRIDPGLWSRSMIAEVYQTLPTPKETT
ncbi:MAG: histidine phosphatase family protein [Clostridia bacterium]